MALHGNDNLFDFGAINTPDANADAGFFGANGFDIGDFGTTLDAFGSLYGAYTGMNQLELGRDQFNFGKDLALTNLGNQANLTNAELSDRQDRRNRNALAGSGGTPLSTADYLSRFGVSGTPGQSYQAPAPVNNTPTQPVTPTEISNFGRG